MPHVYFADGNTVHGSPHPSSSKPSSVNGTGSAKRKANDHDQANSKKKVVWMDISDEETAHTPRGKGKGKAVVNGAVNGDRIPLRRKKSKGNLKEGVNTKQAVLQEQRRQLPIFQGKDALIREIRENDVTVLLGETGSGKTTQIPQYLLESGLAGPSGLIGITQPRRVAATSLASRVSLELNTPLGSLVGYSVRFDEVSSLSTRIKYMTDGMLMRELLSDGLLERYSVVVIDEAHERTLRTDLLVANLRMILRERKRKGRPLKVVIMSATLDAEKFSKFFNNAKVVYIKGRQHPVQIFHTAVSQTDYVDAALRTFFQIHTDRPEGDVLIFLPGQEDIESLEKAIKLYASRLPTSRMAVTMHTMYASLPAHLQSKIFLPAPANTRKCILATNIAETSITIPGIKYVVDTGKCKEKRWVGRDTGGGFDTLLTRDITKSSAMQRAGRAGREGKGYCFRLYTSDSFEAMAPTAEPEIKRCSLTQSFLQLKCLGQDLEDLEFMDKPDIEAIMSALKTLYILGALDASKALTKLGRDMAAFPLEPHLARAVLASVEHGCTSEILSIISVLSSSSKLFFDVSTEQRESASEARMKFRHSSGDHLTILNAVRSYDTLLQSGESKGSCREWCRTEFVNERTLREAREIKEQLKGTCERMNVDWRVSCGDSVSGEESMLKCLLLGLAQNSAFLQPDGSYKQTMGHSIVKVHPGSTLADKKVPAIIYDELVYTTQIYARGVSSVPKVFFGSIAPMNYRQS